MHIEIINPVDELVEEQFIFYIDDRLVIHLSRYSRMCRKSKRHKFIEEIGYHPWNIPSLKRSNIVIPAHVEHELKGKICTIIREQSIW